MNPIEPSLKHDTGGQSSSQLWHLDSVAARLDMFVLASAS